MKKQIWGDHNGGLYYSVRAQHQVFRIDTHGTASLVAGTGKVGYRGDGEAAKAALLKRPGSLWGTREGQLFFTDGDDTLLRRIDEHGIISTVRKLNWHSPSIGGIWGDTSGNIFLSDSRRSQILRLRADGSGNVTVVAGNGSAGYSGDGGPALHASLSYPNGLWGDGFGSLLFAEMGSHAVRRVSPEGLIATVAGGHGPGFSGDGGRATAAQLSCPCDVWGDGYGSLYVADMDNNRVRRVDAEGAISTFAGTGGRGYAGDGSPAAAAALYAPKGVWVDRHRQVYISDTFNRRIRRVDTHGVISTFGHVGQDAADARPWSNELHLGSTPSAGLLISDSSHNVVVKVTGDAPPARFAGALVQGSGGSAAAPLRTVLNHPQGLCATAQSAYLVDSGNSVIREVNLKTGQVRTLGSERGGGPAESPSGLRNPAHCVAVGGELYVTDRGNHRIAAVSLATGEVTHVAGNGAFGCHGGRIGCPYGIATAAGAAQSALFTDPCCPGDFVRQVSLRNGSMETVAAHEGGTAEDPASIAIAGPEGTSAWVPGVDDCSLEFVDRATGKLHPVEILHRDGRPSSLECIMDAAARQPPAAGTPRLDLLGVTKAGEVAVVSALVPWLRIDAPAPGSVWHTGDRPMLKWRSGAIWGAVKAKLVGSRGSVRVALGEAEASSGTLAVSLTGLPVPDGAYHVELRSKRWPLVSCRGGPVHLVAAQRGNASGADAGKPAGQQTAGKARASWTSALRWTVTGGAGVAAIVLVPLCCLRVSVKDYGRLGGAIHYRPRAVFGGGPGVAGGLEMDAMAPGGGRPDRERPPVRLGRPDGNRAQIDG